MGPHPEELLLPFLRDELAPDERARVKAHVGACPDCRDTLAAFAEIGSALAGSAPPNIPPVAWGAYRAELRDRLDRRRAGPDGAWGWRPLPAALAGSLVAALIYLGLPASTGRGPGGDGPLEHAILASRFEVISRLDLLQRLDLLEDLEVIRGLDRLPVPGEA